MKARTFLSLGVLVAAWGLSVCGTVLAADTFMALTDTR